MMPIRVVFFDIGETLIDESRCGEAGRGISA
jgi:FMN phosphatase YigB (HAD superfamily)